MIAGYFETLQGNVTPSGFIISTISPTYSMWDTYGIWDLWDTYSTVTVIPNFFLTGIIAILAIFYSELYHHLDYLVSRDIGNP